MIRIEPAAPVIQRVYDRDMRTHRSRSVPQFVRYKMDGRAFKRAARPKRRSLWASVTDVLFRRAA